MNEKMGQANDKKENLVTIPESSIGKHQCWSRLVDVHAILMQKAILHV